MSGADSLEPGDKVAWNFGKSHVEGIVAEKHTDHLTKTIAGKQISRNGTEDNPAYYITREDPKKNPVVKKGSELHNLSEDSESIPSNQHVSTPANS